MDRPYVEVSGRLPLRYIQDGQGYDPAKRHLGRFDSSANPIMELSPFAPPEPVQKRRGRKPRAKPE